MGGNRFQSGEHIVGKSVQKKFRGYGVFTGKVVSYNSARGFYKIRYEDGDAEEVDVDDVRDILVLEDENGRKRKRDDETPKRRKKRQKNGVGRPRKTPTGEQTPNGGKTPNGGEVRKRGRPRKNRGQEPEVWNTEILEGSRGKEAEVSNTGPLGRSGGKEGEVSNTGPLGRNGVKEGEVSNTGPLEGSGGKEAEVSNTGPLEGSGGKEAEVSNTADLGRSGGKEAEVLNSGDLARSTGKEVEVSNAEPPNRKRFRRKKLDVWNAGPVRRSPRVKESAENAIEKPTQHKRRSRRVNVQDEGLGGSMPSVPQLPPSSSDLGVPEESVSNLLYVYNSLRSFSRLLFLSPFGLDDFVGALNCKSANSLLDAVHVKLLQALRRHLYSVSREEGSAAAAAAKCLRHQDWNFLDMITWPVYLVEYLTAQGFSKIYGQKVSRLRLLDGEYYRTPVPIKLTILQFLCDNVMEAEEIRAEISMRLNDEPDAETDINVNLSPGVRSVKNLRPGRVCRRLWKENEEDDHGSSISNQMLVENVNYVGDKTALQHKLRQSQATKDEKRRSVENLNSDECCLCGMDGTLICCDSCPAAYHSRCVGVSKAFLPEGDWYCPECLVKKRTKGLEALSGLQGAELLGYDPYGRVYFSACGYLLVSDSSFDRAITHKYYNKNDTVKVLKILDSADPLYKNIRNAFVNSRNILFRYRDEPKHKMSTKADNFSDKCSSELSAISVSQSFVQQDRKKGYITTSLGTQEDVNLKKVASQKLEGIHHCDVAGRKEDDEVFVMDQICDNTQLASSEGSLEINSLIDVKEHQKSSERHFNDSGAHRCPGFTKHSALQEELVTETDVGSAAVQVEQVKQSVMGTNSVVGQKRFNSNPSNKEVTFHPNAYINQYVLGDMAASAAANLAVKGAQYRRVNLQVSSKKSPSSALAEQVKIFSREAVHFCWPCFSKKVMEVPKEGCGWCFVCKSSPGSRSRCLLNIAAGNIMTGAARMAGGLRPTKNGDGHFPAIVAYILYMEDQLHGLLEGPWENPSYRKHWRKSIEQASTVAEVKYYLLKLEMNIRPVALAAAWTKPVDDSSIMVSSNRIVTSVAGITPKRGGRFQRGQRHSGATKIISASVDAKMFGVNWWRGGRFSDQVLHWKVLPFSTARRAGRQGGFRRIPGIYYNEGLEIPRRSRQCAWRAAVEMTRSVSQLAVQIRNLDACIRWDDLLNSENFRQLKMVGDKESAVFKKSVICAKNSENGLIKYLIDFGKQKTIPTCIVKQGTKVEEALDGTCKYWLSEYHVPLCLLKDFEEEAQLHAHPNKGSKRFRKVHYRLSKTSKLDAFTILLAKAENREKCSCTHCNKDILIRKAVRCHLCQGSFHRKCSISSHISDKLQYLFTCYQCHGVKLLKSKPEIRVQSEKKTGKRRRLSKKLEEIGTSPQDVKLKKPKRHWLHDDNVAIQKHESVGKVRGRRRKTKGDVQKNESVGKVRGRRRKTKGDVVLDGFLWKKNAADELGKDFRKNMLLLPGQNSMDASVCPKCFLCGQAYNPQFLYVACEYCKDWFHGDAFGLTLENITDVIGFKCYKCRKSSAPICPCAKKDNLCDKRLGLMITSDNEVLDVAKNGKPLEVIYNRSKLVSDKELHAKLAREEEHMLAKVEYDPENGPQDLKVENHKPVPEAEKIPNSPRVIVSEQLLTHRIDRESSVHDYLQEEVVNYQQDKRSREETVGFEVHKMESIQIYPGIQPQSKIVPNCSEKLLPVEGGEDAFSQLPNIQNRSENLLPAGTRLCSDCVQIRSHGEEDAYRKQVLTLPANGKGSGSGSSWGTMGKLDSLEKPLQRPGGSSNNNNNNHNANNNGDVLTLSKTPERVKRDEWSEGAVTTLLDAYESKWLLRNRAKLKGNDWEDVARHVSTRANGTKSVKTQTQCKNKIESMKKRYRAEAATLNGNNSSVNASSWPLYSRLDGLLRCRTAAAAAGDANPNPSANAIGNPPPDLPLMESPPPPLLLPPPPPPPPPPVEERERQVEGEGQRQGQGQEQGQGQKQEEVELVPLEAAVAVAAAAAQDSNQADDGSNTIPNRKESAALDTDTSTPRSKIAHAPCDGSGKGVANNYSCKRRKSSGGGGGGGGGGSSEVAESIRSFADSIVKLEQAKMRLYKDSERLRAETEVRRGEMELKRTEIIAKTQLQIARLLSGKNGKRKLTDRNTNTNTSSTTLALTTAPLPTDAAAHAPPPRSLLGK